MQVTLAGTDVVEMIPTEFAGTKRPPAHCYVYEVWDTQNRLAYAGIADNFERRWRQHRRSSWWLGEITVKEVIVEGYRTRHEARQVEAALINEQAAVYNTEREERSYREYRGLFEDPERPTDDLDCIPVTRVYYRWVH